MSDTYLLFPKGYSGAQQYQQNGQQSDNDQQSQLFKALLQQSMTQAPQNSGAMGTAANLLTKYMMMNQAQPGGMMGSDGVFGMSMGSGD